MSHSIDTGESDDAITAKDFARIVDRTPETIRDWARSGRIRPLATLPSGWRIFSRKDAERIAATMRARTAA